MNLSAVRPSWIAFGWFIAACITGLGLLALISLGIADGQSVGGDPWVAATLTVGFLLGGFFVGVRVGGEALVHGLGMGLFSVSRVCDGLPPLGSSITMRHIKGGAETTTDNIADSRRPV